MTLWVTKSLFPHPAGESIIREIVRSGQNEVKFVLGVSQEDLKEAAREQQAYLKSQDVTMDNYIIVTSQKKMASRKGRPGAQALDFYGAGGRN